MKVLFYVDTGGSTGGPGMHSVLIYRAFLRLHPTATGPFAFAADARDEEIFAKALGRDVLAPIATSTLDDPSADPVIPRADFYATLCEVAREHGCDHIHVLWGFLHPAQIEAVPASDRLPVSVTLCDATGRGEDEDIDAMYFGSERWERYLREALSVRCGYLAISDKTRRDALKKGVTDVETIHLWVSSALGSQRSDEVEDYVLYVGAIADYKGVSHILDLALLYPEQRIVMCGYPSSDFPVDFTRYPSIEFLGYIAYEEVIHRMARARALLYLSYSEGFGLPMLEAQTLGTPLIVNPRNAMVAELLPRGSYVSATNVASPSAIKVAIDVARRDRAEIRTAGFANAARFTEEGQVERMLAAMTRAHAKGAP